MKKKVLLILLALPILFLTLGGLPNVTGTTVSAEPVLVTTVEELKRAVATAKAGDTILVGDITFQPMPAGMFTVSKDVTIRSGKETNAVFTNVTLAVTGTANPSAPLTVRFENIDFRGDHADLAKSERKASDVSAERPGIMKTMCAAMFNFNVDATFTGCTFEGYHYGYGGVFNAKYGTPENQSSALKLTLDDCSFCNNVSKYGGSIYLCGYGRNIELDVRHCLFDSNDAVTGGAVWAQDANVSLLDCSFIGNQHFEAQATSADGGALAVYQCVTDIDGCLFADNLSAGEGDSIYCEISPFRTLVIKNSTLIGNLAATGEEITIALSKTNYDTPAKSYFYFSSFVGRQNFADHVEPFGCLFIGDGDEAEPCEENGYCISMSRATAQEKGLLPSEPAHIILPKEEYEIPEKAVGKVAGGTLTSFTGDRQIGDNSGTEPAPNNDSPEKTNGILTALPWIFAGTVAVCTMIGIAVFLPRSLKKAVPACADVSDEAIPQIPTEPCGEAETRTEQPAAMIVKAWFTEEEIGKILTAFPGVQTLTSREAEVFGELLSGKKQREIAYYLGIEITTVKDYCRKVYDKLGFANKDDLLKRCSAFTSL